MKKHFAMALSMITVVSAGIATNACAQGKTREEVRQELIQAESNGSRLVTDTSYPDVNPIYQQQADRPKEAAGNDVGAEVGASSAAGSAGKSMRPAAPPPCAGPLSFCSPYIGG